MIFEAINDLDLSLATLIEDLGEAESQDVVFLTRVFVKAREAKDELDKVVKAFNKVYEEYKSQKLPEKFEQAGVPSVSLDEGFRVTVSHKVYASIKGGQREAAYEWLRNNQLGDLITETVNSSTLAAVAKSMQEENRELDPNIFNVAVVPNTSVTKVK